MATSPSIVVGKLDRGRRQEVRQCTGQEERSSSKTGPVLVRYDRATAKGQLTVKSERPGSLRKRLLEMVVHLLMSPDMGEGYGALKGTIGSRGTGIMRGQDQITGEDGVSVTE